MSRAILFDVDGVLIHGYHANPARVRAWDANLLADTGVDPDRFRTEFIFDLFVKKVVVGQMALVDALDRRLPGLGYKGSTLDFVTYWLTHDSELNRPLLDLVSELRQRDDCRLFIATNQEHLRANWLWSHLGLDAYFDDIFYSARVGARKPDPAFYRYVDRQLGQQEQPPLFFDDTPAVIEGARRAGWEAVVFETINDCLDHSWIAARVQ